MTVLADDGRGACRAMDDTRESLCIGRSAPVMLRAPYFGLGADTCVTPDTRLKRHGADVEYLAGTDTVLVRAADLVPRDPPPGSSAAARSGGFITSCWTIRPA
jgi:hypothetical protein